MPGHDRIPFASAASDIRIDSRIGCVDGDCRELAARESGIRQRNRGGHVEARRTWIANNLAGVTEFLAALQEPRLHELVDRVVAQWLHPQDRRARTISGIPAAPRQDQKRCEQRSHHGSTSVDGHGGIFLRRRFREP